MEQVELEKLLETVKCCVVTSKQGQDETICGNQAVQDLVIADPEDQTKARYYLVVCEDHMNRLSEGQSFIMAYHSERVAVQFNLETGGNE